jgi:hypothetical protein
MERFILQMCLFEIPVPNSTIQRHSGRRMSVKTTLNQFCQPSKHFMLSYKLLVFMCFYIVEFLDAT